MQPKEFIQELENRKLISDCSNKEKLIKALSENKKIYLGIDPTAPSLHIGHYFSLSLLRRFEDAGYKTVIILGNFTSVIGDPSFKNKERPPLSEEDVNKNMAVIESQVKKICTQAEIIQNAKFYKNLTIVDLLQQICKTVTVNSIISKEFMQQRLATGLTVTEFLYPIFQAYDFYVLHKKHDVSIQIGGSDQWGNMMAGIDLIKRKNQVDECDEQSEQTDPLAVVLTFPLLLDQNNKKFGKSEGNAYFLSPELTKPYALYQYLFNISDDFANNLLTYLSFLPLEKIKEIQEQNSQNKKNRAIQKILANELLTMIYSRELSNQLENISEKLFSDQYVLLKEDFELIQDAIPTITIEASEKVNINEILKRLNFSSSSSESKRLIQDKCISCFNNKITDMNYILIQEDKKFNYSIIKKGKKDFGLVVHKI